MYAIMPREQSIGCCSFLLNHKAVPYQFPELSTRYHVTLINESNVPDVDHHKAAVFETSGSGRGVGETQLPGSSRAR